LSGRHISNYAGDHWDEFDNGTVPGLHAMDESIAELHRLHYGSGNLPILHKLHQDGFRFTIDKEGTDLWHNLFHAVHRINAR
jgi:hypothetical protein